LARALNELAKPHGHAVIALRDKYPPDTEDIQWITDLSKEKNWAVISQDHYNKIDGLEKRVIKQSGLIVFCLKKGWVNQSYWDKSANIIKRFPRLITQAEMITGGAAYWVPLSGLKLEQIL